MWLTSTLNRVRKRQTEWNGSKSSEPWELIVKQLISYFWKLTVEHFDSSLCFCLCCIKHIYSNLQLNWKFWHVQPSLQQQTQTLNKLSRFSYLLFSLTPGILSALDLESSALAFQKRLHSSSYDCHTITVSTRWSNAPYTKYTANLQQLTVKGLGTTN